MTLLFGNSMLPGVFLGSFLANIQAFVSSQTTTDLLISISAVLGIAGGTTLGTWLGTTLLCRMTKQRYPFDSVTDTVKFLIYAGLAGPVINATVGVAMLVLAQKVPLSAYLSVWPVWWISNVAGIFILTPLLLSWSRWTRSHNPSPNLRRSAHISLKEWSKALSSRWVEALVLSGLLLLVGEASFWGSYPLAYMLIPLLAWAAFRFGQLGATLSVFVVSAIAILGTVRGLGTFAIDDLNQSLMGLQSFILVIVFTSLVLVAVLSEQAQAKLRLREAFSDLQSTNKTLEEKTYQLADKNQQLERALQELKATQSQMIQSEKMSALGNLVAGIAHEINNPIGFLCGSIDNVKDYTQDIVGYLTLYRQHHPNTAAPVREMSEEIDLDFLCDDLPKLLHSMESATDRIKSISTSLRIFSRTDSEHKVSANIHDGIDSTLLLLKYRLKANEFRPAIEIIKSYGELPLIECFSGQLNQVFMNILANAIDMFDEASKDRSSQGLTAHPQQVEIQTAVLDNQAQVRIRDNGKGIPESVRARIFDHLFTTKGVGKGTGLGLAIAHQIVVEKHQGRLDVQSKLGQGTEFLIQLPV
jgi:signal transduction histidine kinase